MDRVNVTEDDGWGERRLVGWFDLARAARWSDMDHNHNGSGGVGRGQAVVRTAGGRWVLETWTLWDGESPAYEFVAPDRARVWLIRNNLDDVVEEHFGRPAEEEGPAPPGRPEVGPQVHARLDPELLADVDSEANRRGVSRAETIRALLRQVLTPEEAAR